MSGPLAISLPRFAGPLDLLLELVRSNRVEITDIPIAEITRQYLDYIHRAAELDIDLGAEFTYMAATLIQIKSRSLLPVDRELNQFEPDSRQELIRQLLDHAQVQQTAHFLQQQLEITAATWTRPAETELSEYNDDEPSSLDQASSINLIELARLARRALETARTQDLLRLQASEVSIEEMMAWLEPRLAAIDAGTFLPFETLVDEQPDQSRRIALFLAVLELSKAGVLRLEQREQFETIYLGRPLNGTTAP